MKVKKIVALVAAAAMVLSMAACGSTADNGSNAADGSAKAESTDNASDSDTLVMATNATFPPYEYVDGDECKGIDIEISQAIADAMGKKLVVDDIDFDSIIPAITTGKADMALAGMTVTDERKESVDFSDSYATGVQVIIVPEDSDITGPDDLTDKMIGVQQGTTGHIYCSDTPEKGGFGEDHVTAYPNGASAIQALLTGKVDAVVIDNEPAKAFVAENDGLKILDTEYVTEDYAIAVQKGNKELLDQINTILAQLKADGTLQSIIDKYIKAE
ncbi:basic amino acid ABC transporter substrate-binding protein [uncultured Eubacterium sp.]|uniref:basic amino acid ABC transporter substrate-binding protein n=1 Tax=uncultured Eubacterium sp. TaxID=165185 RepID=UPI0025CC39EA|nr:basic amino acid ABC transporter substrate-binding protein [uncultured Eubacterium sp.]